MAQIHGKTRHELACGGDQSGNNELSFIIIVCSIQKTFTQEAIHCETYSTPASCRWESSL
jgi:hypothetical protein